jgi:hypothetical protein
MVSEETIHLTSLALLNLVDQISAAIDNKKYTVA